MSRFIRFRLILYLPLAFILTILLNKMTDLNGGNGPVIKLEEGQIKGTNVKVGDSFSMDIFYGVPFAEPPIDDNRFERTVPLKPWEGIKLTTKPAPFCPTISEPSDMSLYSEDCLYLNVFRPDSVSDDLLPILFMVHGGGFEEGNSARYANVDQVGRKFVSKGIIVIAIQYRLGVLGFASTGDKEMPGNLGYWDQVEALKFAHRNAKAFGGNPDKITIYGSSAGAASVNVLSIVPHSRDYVHKVISASGSMFGAWATSNNVVENTRQLIYAIGVEDCETVKGCLKRASLAQIYKGLKQIGTTSFGINFIKFGPRLDGEFIQKDYPLLINEAKPKPILIGCSEEESLLWTLVHEANTPTAGFNVDVAKRTTFSEDDVKSFVLNILPEDLITNSAEVQKKVLDFYLGGTNEIAEKTSIFYLQKYTQIFSDLQFNVPIVWDILLRSKKRWPLYVYKSAYVNPGGSSASCPIKTAFHGSDQRYLILGKDQDHYFKMNEDDKKMEQLMVDSFVAFIKTGSPSTKLFEWMPTLSTDPTRYAELKPDRPTIKTGMFTERVHFWTDLAVEYKWDAVRMRPQLEGNESLIWQAVEKTK